MRHFIADINHWGNTSMADRTKQVKHLQKNQFFFTWFTLIKTTYNNDNNNRGLANNGGLTV